MDEKGPHTKPDDVQAGPDDGPYRLTERKSPHGVVGALKFLAESGSWG